MNCDKLPDLINGWTILGALVVAGCLILVTLMSIGWTSARQEAPLGFVPADLTIIPPIHVHLAAHRDSATTAARPRPRADRHRRLRADHRHRRRRACASARRRVRTRETVFVGEEEEIFLVKDGPQQADGYTWWYLVAPYDETRAGWAAADFLAAVPAP